MTIHLTQLKRKIKYNLIRLFRFKAGTHHTALGLAFGFFPCWFPTFGIGAVFSVAIAKVAKANVVAAAISAGIGSFLWPVLFYLNYKMGDFILCSEPDRTVEVNGIAYTQAVEQMNYTKEIGLNFLTGAAINSIVFGIASYLIAYLIFQKYRKPILKKLRKRENCSSNWKS